MFFVNLTLRGVHTDPSVLDRFLARGVNPELGMDPILMDTATARWHKDTAARLADHGLTASLHLPFFDLQPGSADALAEAVLDMLAHRERWPAMRAAGRHFVEDVRNWKNSVANYKAVYGRLAPRSAA